jgi:hypothetical protein
VGSSAPASLSSLRLDLGIVGNDMEGPDEVLRHLWEDDDYVPPYDPREGEEEVEDVAEDRGRARRRVLTDGGRAAAEPEPEEFKIAVRFRKEATGRTGATAERDWLTEIYTFDEEPGIDELRSEISNSAYCTQRHDVDDLRYKVSVAATAGMCVQLLRL